MKAINSNIQANGAGTVKSAVLCRLHGAKFWLLSALAILRHPTRLVSR
jgi:methylthioribose-1-phosphate isomerase